MSVQPSIIESLEDLQTVLDCLKKPLTEPATKDVGRSRAESGRVAFTW